ncbi:MAG TPA: carbohydrate ABC transporter permease, partial [Firmicutes bacterium]|nr:carbohydrate ABC transporter permease [Bacillota bacterium]
MSRAKLRRMLPRVIVNGAVILAMALWIVPTLGLFITSFRPASEVTSSGWWTVLSSPLKFTQFTIENYRSVLSTGGMTTAFRNSFIIT